MSELNEKDNGALGKDAFLKLLVTQLQNQDPTSPMDDKEFIAQMAQFSSLEQMQNMTKAMEDLLASQEQSQLMSYKTFIGNEVKWDEITEELDAEKKPIVNTGQGIIKEYGSENIDVNDITDGNPSPFDVDFGSLDVVGICQAILFPDTAQSISSGGGGGNDEDEDKKKKKKRRSNNSSLRR